MTSSSQYSKSKVIALQAALLDRDPFCSGICAIADHQRLLYYTHDETSRRIDFSNATADDLEALYRACQPAEFGRNGESVLDESYRKAGKMDLTSFSTLFDPRSLGIHEKISKTLLTRSHCEIELELYKLNVYGKGDFFKAHKDTPRGQNMFGSLVVVLPTPHEGGQFMLRQGDKKWTHDFADKLSATTEPSVCFVAFFGDLEHEVLPVTSGYRVTLTYNLYRAPIRSSISSIPTPFDLKLKQTLVDLVNDKLTLPGGGYLGFGLAHEYIHPRGYLDLELLEYQLKGSDRALANACDELGLEYSIRFLYRDITYDGLHLISSVELDVNDALEFCDDTSSEYLRSALEGQSIKTVEGVTLWGGENKYWPLDVLEDENYSPWLEEFYNDPPTEVLEITSMKSSMTTHSPYVMYGNDVDLYYFYGRACMFITVGAVESRDLVG